ncbi:MAG: hypothetical protein CEE43_17025 [Promethearchaeota archaeon Loki_b32]|nr:MAG: hypothetical protein CEE43_17025 [Candidatus Lokiarchaeota archaeon Loki_b32]
MNSITKLQGTKTIKTKRPNLLKNLFTLRVAGTTSSFFVYEDYDFDIRKETSDFIEKHREAFEYLADK